jgi:predicted DNA-binding transcriptional regulator AlpA
LKRQNLASMAPAKGVILLTRHQVMEKLAVSVDTVKRMEQRGQLRPIRLNSRMIRYRLSDVDEMMKRHEAEVSSE